MAFNRIKVGVAAAALLFVATPANAAFDFGDIICETTTTTGTGTLSLGGAVTNYVTFVSQIASGAVVPYHIRASNGTLETGTGTFTDATPDTLTRVADWSTDGSGAELTLPAGTHTVCVGPIASIFNGAKGFQLYTADAGAVGGILPFWHDSATPADGDIAGEIQVWGGADDEEIGQILMEVDDGATTTEDTHWEFVARVGGSDVDLLTIGDTNGTVGWGIINTGMLVPGADATMDIGTSTVGINDLHIGSTGGVINWDGGDVTLTHALNALTMAGGSFFIDGGNRFTLGNTAQISTWNNGSDNPAFQQLGTNEDRTGIGLGSFRGASTVAAQFRIAKSRGTTIGDYTTVAAGDGLGTITWEGSDGTDFFPYANLRGIAADATGLAEHGSVELGWVRAGASIAYSLSGSIAKFWVKSTQSSTTILDNENVASVADTATGRLTVTIGTDMIDADYYANCNHESDHSTTLTLICQIDTAGQAAGTIIFETWAVDQTNDQALTDPTTSWYSIGFGH